MKRSQQLTWYRNEIGYTHTLVEHVILAGMAMNDPEGFAKHCETKYGKRPDNAEKLIKGIE